MNVPDAAYQPLQMLLNHGLRRSSTAQAIAAELDGKCLDVLADGLPAGLRLSIEDGKVRASSPGDDAADATLSGGPLTLTRLLGGDATALIRDGHVRLSGNAELGDRFRDLLRMCRPDPEEELSKLVGDPVAHLAGEFARGVAAWGGQARESVSRSLGEYFTEERQTLPTRTEAEEFFADVDRLANDVERAAARLMKLATREPGN